MYPVAETIPPGGRSLLIIQTNLSGLVVVGPHATVGLVDRRECARWFASGIRDERERELGVE